MQNKINAYLEVIDSGEIYESYPDAQDKAFQISVAFKFFPNEAALDFLEKVKEVLSQSGYELDYYQLSE